MFRELSKEDYADGNLDVHDFGTVNLRSVVKESIDLPAEVLSADFSCIHGRILDQKIIAGLTKPSASESENGGCSKRCRRRKKALTPYLDKRLICVCIRLPGVLCTIEIDPGAEKVIHWEWQSV